MQKGRGGMGSHKHGVGGTNGPNRRMLQSIAREINRLKEKEKKPPKEKMHNSVKELMAGRAGRRKKMPQKIIDWIIIGRPPDDKQKIFIITGVAGEKAANSEEAIKEGLRSIKRNLSHWLLTAIPVKEEDELSLDLRTDLITAFRQFGVAEEELEETVNNFEHKLGGLMKAVREARKKRTYH